MGCMYRFEEEHSTLGQVSNFKSFSYMKYIIIICLIAISYESNAQTEKFKSLFMYKFLQGMEWPAGKLGDKYVIAVLGDQEIINNLNAILKGRNINGKPIEVADYSPGTALTGTSILFISDKKKDLFESLKKEATSSNTVIITESPGLGAKGAFLNFINSGGKLKFEMNQKSFDQAKIRVSTSVSSLAIQV